MAGINWKAANADNTKLVLAEFEKKLAAGRELYGVLDAKAKWLLTVTVPLGTLLTGYVFADTNQNICSSLSALMLAALLFCGSVSAALAVQTKTYRTGARTPDDISEWKPLIEGEEGEAKQFYGMRLETLAGAVEQNDISNRDKGRKITLAIWFACLAAPVAALAFIVCHILFLILIPTGACPAIVVL
jgi:hypothetical protein